MREAQRSAGEHLRTGRSRACARRRARADRPGKRAARRPGMRTKTTRRRRTRVEHEDTVTKLELERPDPLHGGLARPDARALPELIVGWRKWCSVPDRAISTLDGSLAHRLGLESQRRRRERGAPPSRRRHAYGHRSRDDGRRPLFFLRLVLVEVVRTALGRLSRAAPEGSGLSFAVSCPAAVNPV